MDQNQTAAFTSIRMITAVAKVISPPDKNIVCDQAFLPTPVMVWAKREGQYLAVSETVSGVTQLVTHRIWV
jgi:hypothetical protein